MPNVAFQSSGRCRPSPCSRRNSARDIAHAKLKERVDAGQGLPQYFKDHPVYYAGPAKTPAGYASGSFGPTTAGRMDAYVDLFQSLGGSMVMLAKGNRSQQVTAACKKHGGFYLGSIGGPAAILAKDNIRKVELLEYPELGMEAMWKIEVEDFPAFILVDDKGNDFFANTCGICAATGLELDLDPEIAAVAGRVAADRLVEPVIRKSADKMLARRHASPRSQWRRRAVRRPEVGRGAPRKATPCAPKARTPAGARGPIRRRGFARNPADCARLPVRRPAPSAKIGGNGSG